MISRLRCNMLIALGVLMAFAPSATGDHPLHATRATVEFNAETSSFEVALCIFPDDLSQVLSARSGRKINVESDSDLAELLQDYLHDEFQVRINRDTPRTLQWLGHELETQQVWLYFEFPIDRASPSDIQIKNTILMDQFDDQINVAYVRIGARQRCISFRSDTARWQPWKVTRDNTAHPSLNLSVSSD